MTINIVKKHKQMTRYNNTLVWIQRLITILDLIKYKLIVYILVEQIPLHLLPTPYLLTE